MVALYVRVNVTNEIEIKMSQFDACFFLLLLLLLLFSVCSHCIQKTFLLKANNFRPLFTAAKRALNHQWWDRACACIHFKSNHTLFRYTKFFQEHILKPNKTYETHTQSNTRIHSLTLCDRVVDVASFQPALGKNCYSGVFCGCWWWCWWYFSI